MRPSESALPLVYWTAGRSALRVSGLRPANPSPPSVDPEPEPSGAGRTGWISAAGAVVILVVILAAWQGPPPPTERADHTPGTQAAAAEIGEAATTRAGTRQEPSEVATASYSARQSPEGASERQAFVVPDDGAVLLKQVEPTYPAAAKRAGVEGLVIVTYSLDPNGRPTDLKVTKSIPELDDAAVAALRQWQYTPPPVGSTQKYRFNAEFVLDE